MHDFAQPKQFENINQFLIRAVKLQPMCSPCSDQLESRQSVYCIQVGSHEPGDIQVDDPIAV